MKKILLSAEGNRYKANLHCHTVFSDGKMTPEEVKKVYMEHGYSVVAFTDHNVLIPHPELNDDRFLALNGMELNVSDKTTVSPYQYRKTCHLCFIADEPDNLIAPCWHRTKYKPKNELNSGDLVKFDESLPDYERVYSADGVNDMIRICREKGFFVTYNHPTWSGESYPEYMSYHGMQAMEMLNYGCYVAGLDEYNPRVYDDMLSGGERIGCIMTDDNHRPVDAPKPDFCGGWTVILAEKLEYRTIMAALENGNYYCSMGPEIKEITFEDGVVHVTTSPAAQIMIRTCSSKNNKCFLKKDGRELTEGQIEVIPEDRYFRVTVTDEAGNHANSNAYFLDSLFE